MNMNQEWNPLLPFEVTLKEGTKGGPMNPRGVPPHLVVEAEATLEDGRTVAIYLVPKYDGDAATKESYMQCYFHCKEVRDLLNDHIDKIGLMAYSPRTVHRETEA